MFLYQRPGRSHAIGSTLTQIRTRAMQSMFPVAGRTRMLALAVVLETFEGITGCMAELA